MGPLSVNEKTLILNCYSFLSAYKVIKENKTGGVQPLLQSPGRPSVEIEDDLKQGLRRKVHSVFQKRISNTR
jgi:hypothetical protein